MVTPPDLDEKSGFWVVMGGNQNHPVVMGMNRVVESSVIIRTGGGIGAGGGATLKLSAECAEFLKLWSCCVRHSATSKKSNRIATEQVFYRKLVASEAKGCGFDPRRMHVRYL